MIKNYEFCPRRSHRVALENGFNSNNSVFEQYEKVYILYKYEGPIYVNSKFFKSSPHGTPLKKNIFVK